MASRRFISSAMRLAAMSGAVLAGMVGGCRETAQPLTTDAFVSQRVEGRTDPEPIDRPGQVIVEGVKPPVEEQPPINPRGDATAPNEISPIVRDSIRNSAERRNRPATAPAADARRPAPKPAAAAGPTTAPDPSGQYVILGTVLARVNTQPIYAHKVLAILDNALRAEAKQFDAAGFRKIAANLIQRQIEDQINEELVFAVAEKSLDEREKQWANQLTAQWKNEQITRAGGSEEMAKRRWADEGWDFNDRLDYQYRDAMRNVFYQRRVVPQLHVTASEMRQYYETNKDKLFTQPARIKFRVIKIDPRAMKLAGGRSEAADLAAKIRENATKDNFEQLARETNDPVLKSTGGLPGEDGWIAKGSYVAERVEDALWKMKPGEITDVIEEKSAFYIAKLDEVREATSKDFDNAAVQKEIEGELKSRQFNAMREQRQNQLLKDAVIQRHPQMLQIALDMAMQRYAAWKSE